MPLKRYLFHFLQNREDDIYYFDKNGRYIMKEGNKVYQLASCTSSNNLTENGVWRNLEPCKCSGSHCLAKVPFGTCSARVHDLNDAVLLPKSEIINIESKCIYTLRNFSKHCYI